MYDNYSDNNERNCPASGTVCIQTTYLAVIAAIIAGVAAFIAFNAGVLFFVPALFFGALGIVVILGLVILALINVLIIRGERICCCAKRRALWYLVAAIVTLVAIGLYFAIPTIAAVLVGITIGFFVLAVLLFIGFYQCFLRCRCNRCETRGNDE